MGFWSNLGAGIKEDTIHFFTTKPSSWREGFQRVSTVACCVPFYGNMVSVACETGGIISGLRDGKESPSKVLIDGGLRIGIAAIPFGKVIGGFGKVALNAAERGAAKVVAEGTEHVVLNEVAAAAAKPMEKVVSKGVSVLPGNPLGGVSQATLKTAERQAGLGISEALAKQGYKLSAEEAEKLVAGHWLKSTIRILPFMKQDMVSVMLRKDLARGLIMTQEEIITDKLCPDRKCEEENVVIDAKLLCAEKGYDFNKLDEQKQEAILRAEYKAIKDSGIKIIDKSGKEISADTIVKNCLGKIPSQIQPIKTSIESSQIPARTLPDLRQSNETAHMVAR